MRTVERKFLPRKEKIQTLMRLFNIMLQLLTTRRNSEMFWSDSGKDLCNVIYSKTNIFLSKSIHRGTVKSELKAANQQQALGIAILLLVLIISPIIIFLVRNATATIHIFSLTLSTKEQVQEWWLFWYGYRWFSFARN